MSSPAASAQLPAAEAATPARTVVHKFGGTSVADAERYRHVAQLLLAREEALQVTVVSAMKGVTDALIELARMAGAEAVAGQGGADWRERWHALRARHRGAAVAAGTAHAAASRPVGTRQGHLQLLRRGRGRDCRGIPGRRIP